MVFERARAGREATGLEPIVGADPAEERATRGFEHLSHVLVGADVDLIDAQGYAAVVARVALEHPDGPVIRRVVADDEFEIGEILREDGFDAPLDDPAAVSHGEPNRKRRRVLAHRRNLAGNGAATRIRIPRSRRFSAGDAFIRRNDFW